MNTDEMLDAGIAHRLRLCDRLDGLSESEWNEPSLCAGWRVRDVAGHLLSLFELGPATYIRKSIFGGGFNKVADKVAREFGERSPSDLAAGYRALAIKRFKPPIIGPIAPLTDILVHTRDIERPLGYSADLDPASVIAALSFLTGGGKASGFLPSKRVAGLGFEATDLNWSGGSGATASMAVTGTGEALMLAISGRKAALADLTGGGLAEFRVRLG